MGAPDPEYVRNTQFDRTFPSPARGFRPDEVHAAILDRLAACPETLFRIHTGREPGGGFRLISRERPVFLGSRRAPDLVAGDDRNTLILELKAGYCPAFRVGYQMEAYRGLAGSSDLPDPVLALAVCYRETAPEVRKILRKAPGIQVVRIPEEPLIHFGIRPLDYAIRQFWLPRMSYVVETNSQNLVLARPNLAVSLTRKETEEIRRRLGHLQPGTVVTAAFRGEARYTPGGAVISKPYWPDHGDVRASWETRYQPNRPVRPCLYPIRSERLTVEDPNFILNTRCVLRFVKDEFGQGPEGELDVGFST